MDIAIALSVITLWLIWIFKDKKSKKTVIDYRISELTDKLHEQKCAIMEVSLFIKQIETMRWNDYKDFRFSFGSGDSNFTRSFQSYFNGMSHKKHLRQIKAFAYEYLEDESQKYRQTLEELHKYFYKINSTEKATLDVEKIVKTPKKFENDFDITAAEDVQVDESGQKVEEIIEVLEVE